MNCFAKIAGEEGGEKGGCRGGEGGKIPRPRCAGWATGEVQGRATWKRCFSFCLWNKEMGFETMDMSWKKYTLPPWELRRRGQQGGGENVSKWVDGGPAQARQSPGPPHLVCCPARLSLSDECLWYVILFFQCHAISFILHFSFPHTFILCLECRTMPDSLISPQNQFQHIYII